MQAIKTKFKKATATSRGRIIASTVLLLLLAVIAGGIWYWNTHKKAIIRNELEKAINKKSQGLYKIAYSDMSLDEITGSLSVSNMKLAYDSVKFDSLKMLGKAPSVLLNVDIPGISVTGVKTPRALLNNEIIGTKLVIRDPLINIIYTYTGKDSARNVPTKEVYEQILGNLDLIQIDTVIITGAQIITNSIKTGKKNIRIQDISMSLTNFRVDSTSNADTSRLLFAKEIDVTCGKLAWLSDNRLYNYILDSISMSSRSRELRIKSLQVDPTLGEEAFVKALPTQDDRFDFSINHIRLRNFNLSKLFEEYITADSMLIRSASFKVYRDLAIPRDKKNRVGDYPHQVMDDIPLSFGVKKVIVSGAFVEYKERNHITRQSGKVQFYNVYAAFSNFTNDNELIAANNLMTASITSRFLNKTSLKTKWEFFLRHPRGRFNVKGSAGPIDAQQLNPLTVPMGPARIKEGMINGLEFNLQGHNYGMDGTVKMLYEDLKVNMLEKDKGSATLDKKSLMTFLANFVIKNSNPEKNEDTRIAKAHFDRDINRSIFHLCWKTLFKGIRQSLGIKK